MSSANHAARILDELQLADEAERAIRTLSQTTVLLPRANPIPLRTEPCRRSSIKRDLMGAEARRRCYETLAASEPSLGNRRGRLQDPLPLLNTYAASHLTASLSRV